MMGRHGPARAVPAHTHPLVRKLYRELELGGWTWAEIAKVSGVSEHTIRQWPRRHPRLDNVEAVLNALGLELVLREKQT